MSYICSHPQKQGSVIIALGLLIALFLGGEGIDMFSIISWSIYLVFSYGKLITLQKAKKETGIKSAAEFGSLGITVGALILIPFAFVEFLMVSPPTLLTHLKARKQ